MPVNMVNILVMISSGHVFMNSQFREMMRYKIRHLNACELRITDNIFYFDISLVT